MAGLERFTLRPAERRLHASDHVPTVDFDTLKRASADCSDAAAHQRTWSFGPRLCTTTRNGRCRRC